MTTTVLAYIPSPSQGVWYLFGVVPLRAYALCIIAGIVAALVIGDRRWVARGGEQGVIYDVALWAVPFGLFGGRLYHVMTDWPKYFGADGAGFLAALRIWDGGLGIWGAVALGAVGAWIACRRRDIPLPAFGDAVAPGIILAQAIGRLGNYFNQELYGRETDLPWGLTIWERLDPSGVVSPHSLDGVSTGQVYAVVHPTFLYELLWNVLIFALLIWVDRRFKIGHGRLFALYVAGYCVGRFWVELMRSDTATLIAGIRVNTFTSMFVFIAAVVYIMVAPKGREDPASLRGKDFVGNDESVLDGLGEELTAVAATSGVVAAAKAAGADEITAEPPADDPETSDVPAVALEGTEVAEALQAEVDPEPEATAAPEPAEGDSQPSDESTAESTVETAAPDEEAEPTAGEDASVDDDVTAEPTDGLGSVDGDEVAAAEDSAAEVHDAALEGTANAETAAEDVTAEDTDDDVPTEPTAGVAPDEEAQPTEEAEPTVGEDTSVDGDEVAATEESAAEDVTAEVSPDATVGAGSVDGDEVAAEAGEPLADNVVDAAPKDDAVAPTEQPRRRWWRRG